MTNRTTSIVPSAQPTAQPPARTREHLLELHRLARQRRDAAPLGSEAYKEAVTEVCEIEVEIASIEIGVPPSRR
jgi:hypothetical protein